jgi:dTDP-4-dehydrorhamnose reductase
MKILIIGSKGMLGQYIVQVFSGYDLVFLDRKELDITDQDQVNTKIIQIKPDVVINCAAYNNVDLAESEPELANLINGFAVGYLARAANQVGALMVHFSTNYVFRGDCQDGYSEFDVPDPQSAYGVSKFLGEQELQNNTDKYYLIRTSRLFGRRGSTQDAKKTFIDLMFELAKNNGDRIRVINEEYDLPTYAFDLAGKTKEIMETKSDYGIYHVVNSGDPCTWYDFAREIFDIKKMRVEIEPVSSDAFGERPAKRLAYAVLKNTKLGGLRGWREALRGYLNV